MSWAIFSMIASWARSRAGGAAVQLQAVRPGPGRVPEPYDVLLTPALAERPLKLGTLDTAAPDPMSTSPARPCSRPYPGHQRQRAARHLGAAVRGRGGLPLGIQLAGAPPARRRCWRSPRSSRRPRRGRRASPAGARRRRRREPVARSKDSGRSARSAPIAEQQGDRPLRHSGLGLASGSPPLCRKRSVREMTLSASSLGVSGGGCIRSRCPSRSAPSRHRIGASGRCCWGR